MSKLRANQIVNKASTGAPTAPNGLVVTGVSTATSFSGSGANLTSLPSAQLTGAVPTTKGGTGLTSLGTAGQALKVNSSGNGLEYGSAAVIKKIHSFEFATRTQGSSSNNNNQFTWTTSFTPLDPVNNSFWIDGSVPVHAANQDFCGFGLRFERSGGSLNDFNGYGVQYVDQTQSHMSFMGYNFVYSGNFDGAGTYTIYHRTFSSNSHADYYCPNSSDDSRLSAQTRAFLQIIEYKNA